MQASPKMCGVKNKTEIATSFLDSIASPLVAKGLHSSFSTIHVSEDEYQMNSDPDELGCYRLHFIQSLWDMVMRDTLDGSRADCKWAEGE